MSSAVRYLGSTNNYDMNGFLTRTARCDGARQKVCLLLYEHVYCIMSIIRL